MYTAACPRFFKRKQQHREKMLLKSAPKITTKEEYYKSEIRFKTASLTLTIDRFMNRFIKIGGAAVIAVVIGIFVFIISQTLPLFMHAKVHESGSVALAPGTYAAIGIDEWDKLPFVVKDDGTIQFIRVETGALDGQIDPLQGSSKELTFITYKSKMQTLVYGTADSRLLPVKINYTQKHGKDKTTVEAAVENEGMIVLSPEPGRVLKADLGESADQRLAGAILELENGARRVHLKSYVRESSLFGPGEFEEDVDFDLTDAFVGEADSILINGFADRVILSTTEGKVYVFNRTDDEMTLLQVFEPFSDLVSKKIGSMNYLFGDESLVFTHESGKNVIYSMYVAEGSTKRKFGLTKNFKDLPGTAEFYDSSLRNKAFLVGRGDLVSLRYATTEAVRWEHRMPFDVKQGILGRRYKSMVFLDESSRLHFYELKDEHPAASFKAFFSKIWYEGYTEPGYEWQSTGGSDEFEPKLSLVPLIIGTLKGTFYALLVALPIAILAALYTSQFAHKKFKTIIKPMMEVMASLPSVVLGFLAALWLAPILETKIPSLMLVILAIPVVSLSAGFFWTRLPISYRKWLKPGYEWIALLPLLFISSKLAWDFGPLLESKLFRVEGVVSNQVVADFRLWWTHVTGLAYEQRNSVIIGIMMGFAVIPIIFTIAEDSLSNVPQSLMAGSMALGASRWQTAFHVILPTAFPGIFSAIMIGIGRAVGETMIVVMATGNTPIMDFNIFSGMRTLSANIAVELPEAPYLGTLYRTLFLGAVVLFMMTFVMNTVADIIRQRIREKYKTV